MKTIHGWAFPDVDQFMAAEMKADGSYQGGHLTAALQHVIDFSCAVDAGAHVGTWSRPLSARFIRVLAFEPSPDTFEALSANMDAFGCGNVELHHRALGATSGFVSMAPLEPRAEAMKNTGARFVQDGADIPRVTIDSFNLPTLGFLKIDVEGSEPLVLEGARDTLARCKPIVLFEHKGFCRRFGYGPDAPIQILTRAGYELAEIAGKDQIWRARS